MKWANFLNPLSFSLALENKEKKNGIKQVERSHKTVRNWFG